LEQSIGKALEEQFEMIKSEHLQIVSQKEEELSQKLSLEVESRKDLINHHLKELYVIEIEMNSRMDTIRKTITEKSWEIGRLKENLNDVEAKYDNEKWSTEKFKAGCLVFGRNKERT
jgi:hypothetical protein